MKGLLKDRKYVYGEGALGLHPFFKKKFYNNLQLNQFLLLKTQCKIDFRKLIKASKYISVDAILQKA